MAIGATVADINAFTNKYIVPRTTDVVYKESPLFVRMITKQNVKFEGGTLIQVPIMYAKLNGGAFSKGETFNTAYVQTDAAFNVNMKYSYVNVTLYGTDDVLNRGREAAFSIVETKLANASLAMADILTKQIYADGQTSAADSVTSAGVLTTTANLDGLLAWVDDGNASSGNYSSATDVTKSFTTIGGLTRSDLFATAPSWAALTATPATAIGGANAYVERSFTNFQLNTVNKAYGYAWFGNRYVDLMITTQEGWNKFWNAIQPNQRFMEADTDLAKIGFQSFRFNGASVVVDKNCPANLLLGLNTNFVELYVTTSPKFQFGFTGFKEAMNSVDVAGQYLFGGNTVLRNPRTCFKLIGSALA